MKKNELTFDKLIEALETNSNEKYFFSKHCLEKIQERGINVEWILITIQEPEKTEIIAEDETCFYKFIKEFDNKCLKVAINPITKIVITAYFDRKKTKKGLK